MRYSILLSIIALLTLSACSRNTSTPGEVIATGKPGLPRFEAVDTDGNRLLSDQVKNRAVIVVFFDPESVLAWRTLSELERKIRLQKNASLIAVAGSQIESAKFVDINPLREQFEISSPIVADQEQRFLRLFQSPNWDHLQAYDSQGILKNSMRLSSSYDKIDSVIGEVVNPDMPGASQARGSDLLDHIRVSTEHGPVAPLPIATQGLTVVNLFGEFCSQCATGNRLETIARLNQSARLPGKVLMIFSDRRFSAEDLNNFKLLLSSDSMIQGDIEVANRFLIEGKLLVVFDSNRNLVWQEKPGMNEEEVLSAVSQLF